MMFLYRLVQPYKHQQVLSLALLSAKYFIYKCSLAEESLLFKVFIEQFRENVMIERYIALTK